MSIAAGLSPLRLLKGVASAAVGLTLLYGGLAVLGIWRWSSATAALFARLGKLARGELMRHFAESQWFPTALLPSQGVVWATVDDTTARATMTDGPISVTLLFRFGAEGLVASIHADNRGAQVGKTIAQMSWECRMSNYRTQDGMCVPMTGEVFTGPERARSPVSRALLTRWSTSLQTRSMPGPRPRQC